jgi:hypothetical protein
MFSVGLPAAGEPMTRFEELLQKNQEDILRGWLEAAMSSYPKETAAAFSRQTDRFANPVGHSLREGTRRILQALLTDAARDEIRRHLTEIVRIRSVQAFSASEAIGFIFELKAIVRTVLGSEADQPQFATELAQLDARIDHVALAAVDMFVECRERVFALRASEVERRFSWLAGKVRGRSESGASQDPDTQSELIR